MTITEAHKFFCRESQHYVLGGWYEHADRRKRLMYLREFPGAYVRFMWHTLRGR